MRQFNALRPVPVRAGCIDFVEVAVALGSLEHNLSIYLMSLAKRSDGEGAFYRNIVEQQLENVQTIKAEMDRALKEHQEGAT